MEMPELTKAEDRLKQYSQAQNLINRLNSVIQDYNRFEQKTQLKKETKAKIENTRSFLQDWIKELYAKQKETVDLINQIPTAEVRTVLEYRYGISDQAGKMAPWLDVAEHLYFEMATIYKYHRLGIDYINKLLGLEAKQTSGDMNRVKYAVILPDGSQKNIVRQMTQNELTELLKTPNIILISVKRKERCGKGHV